VVEIRAIVLSTNGIHARPSMSIAIKAREYKSIILIHKDSIKDNVNAKEVLPLLSCCFEEGDTLLVRASGPDECEAAEAIAHLIETLQY